MTRFGRSGPIWGGLAMFGLVQLALAVGGDRMVLGWFAHPAGRAAGWFLGTTAEQGADGVMRIWRAGLEVAVTEACSGTGFFALMAGLLTGAVMDRLPRRWVLIAVLPGAYGFAMCANVARIVCAVHAQEWASRWLPSGMEAAVHMAVGVAVFVSVAAVVWAGLDRLTFQKDHGDERRQPHHPG